jgi:hypothetical protein
MFDTIYTHVTVPCSTDILELQANELTGNISSALCSRVGEGFNDLKVLTTDCDEVPCDCCTECF